MTQPENPKPPKKSSGPAFDKRLVNGIAILVSTIWAISLGADIIVKDYDPSPFVHLAMMAVVGAVVGHGFIKGSDN